MTSFKPLFVLLAAFSLIIGVFACKYYLWPSEPLAEPMEAKQAIKVYNHLQNKRFPCKLSDDGKTIYVPPGFLYKARMSLFDGVEPDQKVEGAAPSAP